MVGFPIGQSAWWSRSLVSFTTQDPPIKFHRNPFITFYVILLIDKQTERKMDKQTNQWYWKHSLLCQRGNKEVGKVRNWTKIPTTGYWYWKKNYLLWVCATIKLKNIYRKKDIPCSLLDLSSQGVFCEKLWFSPAFPLVPHCLITLSSPFIK